jgi:DHA1 family tetracycline resistance protein-like MFS transporter
MNDSPPAVNARSAKMIVFLIVVIDLLGFGIVLPLLPRFADTLLPAAGIDDEKARGFVIGGLMSVFSLMQFIFAPIWGRISDRIGRRPILLLGLVGSVVFYALFGYACSLGSSDAQLTLILILVSRIGAGIAGATISTAQAVIADSTPKEKRASGMALIGVAFGVGFTFGPILAALGMLAFPDHYEFAGYSASLLSLIALLIAIARMPETRVLGAGVPGPEVRRHWLNIGQAYSTLQTPTVGILVLIFFLATFGFAKLEGTLSLLTQDLGFSDRSNFWIFAYVGAVLMVAQGYLYRKFVKKYHEVSLMRVGVVLMFLGLAGLAIVALGPGETISQVLFYLALASGVTGFAFMTPSLQALISQRSDQSRQGEILGVNQSFSALARILGPWLGILLFKWHPSHILPYVTSAALLVLVMLLLPKIKR